MKKNAFLTLFLICTIGWLVSQEQVKEPKKNLSLRKAYAYQEESLLVSETDNNCTFFIRKEDFPEDIRITGSQRQDDLQTTFAQPDLLFINSGSQNGLKEGDTLLVIGKGSTITDPFSRKKLGTYYVKKGLAVINCIYEDRAVIQLTNCCHPVEVGDIMVPYKAEKTIWQKKLIYSLCRIPPTPLEGRVVYNDIYIDVVRESASTSNYVSVDLGEGLVEKGTFLLFYRVWNNDLPPFIIGLGIVVHPESNNSTVKILDSAMDINLGDRAAVLTSSNELKIDTQKKEQIPIVETLTKEEAAAKEKEAEAAKAEKKAGEEGKEAGSAEGNLTFDLYFDFDSKEPPAGADADLEKISNFIKDKSEYVIILRGYCCSIGNSEYNLKLSQERVNSIKSVLSTKYKIDPTHIETYFYGEENPLHDNSQEVERKKNRLVKVEVVGK